MNPVLKSIYGRLCSVAGSDPALALRKLRNVPRFLQTAVRYRAARYSAFPLRIPELFPILEDFDESAGSASGHYFFQDLWAAAKVFERRPDRHMDIGSRIDGFVAHEIGRASCRERV